VFEDAFELYFQYAPDEDWRIRFGRERILLDDQRYVGGVGWRQNEQTYDGASLLYKGFANTEVFYSYVNNVNRIFGREVTAGDHDQDTHLLNVNVGLTDAWKVIRYTYIINNEDAPAFFTSTFGARLMGTISSGDSRYKLLGEFATQSDNSNNPADYDANYFCLEGIWSRQGFSAGAGFESLGSDNGQGFRTPLATLHAFQGWAEQFLSTPGAGIEDLYFKAGYKPGKWNMQLVYRDLSAERGSGDYGSEIDVAAAHQLTDRYGLLLKLASFNADDPPFVDTTKIWVMLTAAF